MCLYLLGKLNANIFYQCCEQKLCPIIGKLLTKEKDPYVRKCLDALITAIYEIVTPLSHQIAQELESSLKVTTSKQKVQMLYAKLII